MVAAAKQRQAVGQDGSLLSSRLVHNHMKFVIFVACEVERLDVPQLQTLHPVCLIGLHHLYRSSVGLCSEPHTSICSFTRWDLL